MDKDKIINDIGEIISKLDTSIGMLMVPSTKSQLVKDATRNISEVSFELSNLIDEIE